MADFLLIYRSSPAASGVAFATPEMAQQSMQRWIAWIRELEAQGHLKDAGQPLEPSGMTVQGKNRVVTDGPFAETRISLAASLSSRPKMSRMQPN